MAETDADSKIEAEKTSVGAGSPTALSVRHPLDTIPGGKADVGVTSKPSPRLTPADLGLKRVLIVEDEALIALDIERRLIRLGFDVVGVADNREEALELFHESSPDLVLMDIFIRGPADGIETAEAISAISDVPVIFLTAFADDETIRRASAVSPYGYVIKPFDERTLTATISVAIERYKADVSARLLRAAVEASPLGIAVVRADEADDRVVFANHAIVSMSGAEAKRELQGLPFAVSSEPDQESVLRLKEAMALHIQADAVIKGQAEDGNPQWTSVSVSPVADRGGRITHMLVSQQDITRERRAEAVLLEAQRTELVGRLTTSVAHDFNNVLCVIIMCADLMLAYASDPAAQADIEEILYAARRGVLLTRKLLSFARRKDIVVGSDLSTVLSETMPMIERLVTPRVKIDLRVAADSMAVSMDATSVEQILLNMATNARDAMPEGGCLTLSASRPAEASGGMLPGHYVRLEIADTGTGMDEATLARVFEPLFTTKPKGAGTGIGLSTCAMLVDYVGGAITVRSKLGEGTIFAVDLPLAEGMMESQGVAPTPGTLTEASGACCLLVDDDVMLRRACARALAEVGFVIVEARNDVEAVRELTARGAAVRLIIADLALPGIGGAQLVLKARALVPGIATLLITGHFDSEQDSAVVGTDILWKPFSTNTLTRRALDAIDSIGAAAPVAPGLVSSEDVPEAPPTEPARGLRVLLVEADDATRATLAGLLEARGLAVLQTTTGAEALAIVDSQDLHVAVIAMQLPDGEGVEVLAALRRRGSTIPTLLVGADRSFEGVRRALQARATSYLTTPVAPDDFVEQVGRAAADGEIARLQHQLLSAKLGHNSPLLDFPTMGRELDAALRDLFMVYQPIVRSLGHSIFAYETLMRSRSTTLAGPMQILAAAEALGRIQEVGRVVRRHVAATLRDRPQCYEPIFVNLHPSELRADILLAADEPLLPFASRIVFEVTERAQLDVRNDLSATLKLLRAAGYRIALDDLGEGYAGLSWLVKLTPDIAKLDMSLIRDLHTSRIKRELVASLVSVCRRTHTTIIAEGVETADEANVLIDLGCDLMQGYYFARPGPPFPAVLAGLLRP